MKKTKRQIFDAKSGVHKGNKGFPYKEIENHEEEEEVKARSIDQQLDDIDPSKEIIKLQKAITHNTTKVIDVLLKLTKDPKPAISLKAINLYIRLFKLLIPRPKEILIDNNKYIELPKYWGFEKEIEDEKRRQLNDKLNKK